MAVREREEQSEERKRRVHMSLTSLYGSLTLVEFESLRSGPKHGAISDRGISLT